jgi:hypothetical protein
MQYPVLCIVLECFRGQLKCDGTRAETRFRLSCRNGRVHLNRPWWASVQSTAGSRGVRIGGSNVGYTMFRGSVKGTGYPLHSTVSPSLPLQCVTVCHHISTGLYYRLCRQSTRLKDVWVTDKEISQVFHKFYFLFCVPQE